MRRVLLMLAFLVVAALPAQAQTTVANPTTLEFTPSPAHATIDAAGFPVLLAYEGRYATVQPGCAAVPPVNLAKPTPVNNLISLPAPIAQLPLNCVYTFKVVSVGQAGLFGPESPASNPFVRYQAVTPGAAGTPVLK